MGTRNADIFQKAFHMIYSHHFNWLKYMTSTNLYQVGPFSRCSELGGGATKLLMYLRKLRGEKNLSQFEGNNITILESLRTYTSDSKHKPH